MKRHQIAPVNLTLKYVGVEWPRSVKLLSAAVLKGHECDERSVFQIAKYVAADLVQPLVGRDNRPARRVRVGHSRNGRVLNVTGADTEKLPHGHQSTYHSGSLKRVP